MKSVTKIVKNEKYQSFHLPIDMALRSSKIFFVCFFLPWSFPGSAADDDAGSRKEGWGPSPPGLVLPPWKP